MATSESFVKFEKVDKSYDGEVLVVKDLNVDIPKGEFLTMLGPSGSGKTTTLMMLAGFETPTSGEIYLDGEAINKIPPYKRGIGMVFQNYALFPHMTVKENLAFPLEVRKLSKSDIDKKVKKALDMAAVERLILSDSLDEKKIVEFEKKAEETGAEVKMVSSETREGEQLKALGGVGAILRFVMY